jgi:outer membrane protein
MGKHMRFWVAAAVAALSPAAALAETLPEALAQAYAGNPTLAAARAQQAATDENFAQARAGFLPQLGATGTLTTQRVETENTNLAPSSPLRNSVSELDPQTYGLRATQSIYAGGANWARLKQADAVIAAGQQGLRSTEQQVLLQAIAAYVDVIRDEEQVRIRRSNVDVLKRQLQAANDRFKVGEITRTDVAQAQARLAGAEANLAAGVAALEGSRAQYGRIIGVAPAGLQAPPPPPPIPPTIDAAIDAAVDANPDLQRLMKAEEVARRQIAIEAAALKPDLSIVGQVGRSIDASGRGFESDSTSASAQLTIPLFEGGLARSRTRQAKINLTRARIQSEEARRGVVSTVTAAWNDLNAARQVITASREQERAARLALDGAEQELQVGLRTTLDVLNAQQELFDAQLTVARAERDAYVAHHQLLQAIGALTPQAVGVKDSLYDPAKSLRRVKTTILSTKPVKTD